MSGKTLQLDTSSQQMDTFRTHQKEPSNLTYRSDYPMSEDSKMPPSPLSRPPRPEANAVERQKMKIKESMLEIKKLETESSHDLLDRSVDFDLSDEEAEAKDSKKEREEGLRREKKEL